MSRGPKSLSAESRISSAYRRENAPWPWIRPDLSRFTISGGAFVGFLAGAEAVRLLLKLIQWPRVFPVWQGITDARLPRVWVHADRDGGGADSHRHPCRHVCRAVVEQGRTHLCRPGATVGIGHPLRADTVHDPR